MNIFQYVGKLFLIIFIGLSLLSCSTKMTVFESEPLGKVDTVWQSSTSDTFIGSVYGYKNCTISLYANSGFLILRALDEDWKDGTLLQKVIIYKTDSGMFMKIVKYFYVPEEILKTLGENSNINIYETEVSHDIFDSKCGRAVPMLPSHVKDKMLGFYGTTLRK